MHATSPADFDADPFPQTDAWRQRCLNGNLMYCMLTPEFSMLLQDILSEAQPHRSFRRDRHICSAESVESASSCCEAKRQVP